MNEGDHEDFNMTNFQHVVQPLEINGVTIPNRIFRSAHQTTYAQGSVTDQFVAYQEARAKGGVGLIVLETATVHHAYAAALDASTDRFIGELAKVVSACHRHGTKVFQQLAHGGVHAPPTGSPPWSPSPNPCDLEGTFPTRVAIEMTKGMIDEVVEGFGAGARRVKEGGADGVELHAAHTYLPHQFLSPATNQRQDDYGGSLENRMRFTFEALTAIRDAVGPDYPVGIRVSSSEFNPWGFQPSDIAELVRQLEARKLINYVSYSIGDSRTYHRTIATTFEKRGHQVPYAKEASQGISIPKAVIGRFITLEDAEKTLAAGDADLVGMLRATIADPAHIKKTLAGEKPRLCISCNTCAAGLSVGAVRCSVNATVGSEYIHEDDVFSPAEASKHILIVGGGPAGLETARVAAARGHKVTLFEARSELGGQQRFASRVPGREDVAGYLSWLEHSARSGDVDIRLSTPFSTDVLNDLEPVDHLVNAAGPALRPNLLQYAVPGFDIEIADDSKVMTWPDIFENTPEGNGRTAVILDDVGYAEGYCTAIMLISKGWKVVAVSRMAEIAPRLATALYRETVRPLLHRTGQFEFLPHTYVHHVGEQVIVRSLDDDWENNPNDVQETKVAADLFVPIVFGYPNNGLTDGIAGDVGEIHTIGDALAPHRYLAAAVADGNQLGRKL